MPPVCMLGGRSWGHYYIRMMGKLFYFTAVKEVVAVVLPPPRLAVTSSLVSPAGVNRNNVHSHFTLPSSSATFTGSLGKPLTSPLARVITSLHSAPGDVLPAIVIVPLILAGFVTEINSKAGPSPVDVVSVWSSSVGVDGCSLSARSVSSVQLVKAMVLIITKTIVTADLVIILRISLFYPFFLELSVACW